MHGTKAYYSDFFHHLIHPRCPNQPLITPTSHSERERDFSHPLYTRERGGHDGRDERRKYDIGHSSGG